MVADVAQEQMVEIAGLMYAYNINVDSMQDPESTLWATPIDGRSPSEFVEESTQFGYLIDSITQRTQAAESALTEAAAAQASAERAAEETSTSVAAAELAEHRASAAAKAARQVYLRVVDVGGRSADEAWWAHASANSDLGQMLASLRGGPEIQLAFSHAGSDVITSGFGMRVHPITHEYKLHTGVDYAVGNGRFYAAKAGKVVRAEYDVAYGNYIVILHGQSHSRSVATLYAHSAALYVREGDHVNTGELLGLVGQTGYATGPHLHFELRIDGRPVNPERFME